MRYGTPYGVQMRNTSQTERGTWATLVRDTREAARLTKVGLAQRLDVDRATVLRWENGSARPERAEVIQRFADLFGIPVDDALFAAGLRPSIGSTRTEPSDPDVARLIRLFEDPDTPEIVKNQIRATMRALLELADAHPRPPKRRKAAS